MLVNEIKYRHELSTLYIYIKLFNKQSSGYTHRLREPEPPQRGPFPLFGSKFRYSGRTQYQSRNSPSTLDRKAPTIDRLGNRRFAGSPFGTLDRSTNTNLLYYYYQYYYYYYY